MPRKSTPPAACLVCGAALPPRKDGRGRYRKYCSSVCQKMAIRQGIAASRRGLVDRECARCGKPFRVRSADVDRGWGTYCSRLCQNGGGGIERTCKQCGAPFKVQPIQLRKFEGGGSYCSNTCRSKARRTGEDRSCQQCGMPFYVRQVTSPRRFCSVGCQRESRRRDCEACGASFIPTSSIGRFCSIACRNTGHRVFEAVACDFCGKSVKSYPDYPRRFCSNKCQGAALLRDNPQWDGTSTKRPSYPTRKWSDAVKARDGGCCQSCGSASRLHAHHIKPWSEYPELRYEVSNGVTLCRKCHLALHNQMRPAQLRLQIAESL